jgi:DNA polymerase-3 subunit delta
MAPMARKAAPTVDASTRVLVLHGPEEYVKRQMMHTLREALREQHGEVETFGFDGRSASLADVLDEVRGYSLMMTYKLVIVDDAEEFVKKHRDAVTRYAESPVDHATLVLRANTWHPGNLDKAIAKVGAVVKCEALKPAEAQAAIGRWAQVTQGVKLSPQAAGGLVERLGTHMLQLETEVAKLAMMVEPGGTITPDLVEQVVGRSSEEQAWVVQDAVLASIQKRSPREALEKVHELVDLAGQADVLVTYFVADLMRKLGVAVLARRAGTPDAVVAKQLKLWGPRQHAVLNLARRLETGQAAAWFDAAVAADAGAKSGRGEALRNLECFCVRLADEAR